MNQAGMLVCLVLCTALAGCRKEATGDQGVAGEVAGHSMASAGESEAAEGARGSDGLVPEREKFPTPSKAGNPRVAEYEDLVMNRPNVLVEKLKSMGAGRERIAYISELFSGLTIFSDSDPEVASQFLELLDRNIGVEDKDVEWLTDRATFLAQHLGKEKSISLYEQLSTPNLKRLVATGLGGGMAADKAVPSEEELNRFALNDQQALLGAFRSKIKFGSADELALFVETYEGKGDRYQPLVDGGVGNSMRLDSQELLHSAAKLSNPAAAEKVFRFGMDNFIRQDAMAASKYLADHKNELDEGLYQTGAKTLAAYLDRVGDKEAAAQWLKEAESGK